MELKPDPGPLFYLFVSWGGEPGGNASSVFYKVRGQAVAEGLCGLFKREYSQSSGGPAFSCVAGDGIPAQDQVLLDEALGGLELYSDPDPGVYDPEPGKDMILRAQYGVRAGEWEPLLREKLEAEGGGVGVDGDKAEEVQPPPWGDGPLEMPEEDGRNGALGLLMLLAQAYYRLLEAGTYMGGLGATLDLKLNHSYFWVVRSLRNLLRNDPYLKDFPMEFKPALPDLYPSRIRDVDWTNELAPAAEDFLSTVQAYVMANGMYEPEEKTPAWIFIELFRPGINNAIEAAMAYRDRMGQMCQEMLDAAGGGAKPQGDRAPAAPEASGAKAPGSGGEVAGAATPAFLFRQAGRMCDVVFEGSPVFHISNNFGAKYLDYLLHHPNVEISAFDLEVAIRPEKGKARAANSAQQKVDARTKREAAAELAELRAELEEAEAGGAEETVDRLRDEIAKVQQVVGDEGMLDGDTGERARDNVRKAIGKVVDALRKGTKEEKAFAAHIEQFVSLGYKVRYNQPGGECWQ